MNIPRIPTGFILLLLSLAWMFLILKFILDSEAIYLSFKFSKKKDKITYWVYIAFSGICCVILMIVSFCLIFSDFLILD